MKKFNKISIDSVASGMVVSYSKGWNLLSREAYVIVAVKGKRIVVGVDARQQRFIRKEHPPGSDVAVGFYDGKWHIGSKPVVDDRPTFEENLSAMEILTNLKKSDPC